MKQFIVLAAVLPILMLFIMQFSLEQRQHDAISMAQEIVNQMALELRNDQYGIGFEERYRIRIAECLNVNADEILIEININCRDLAETSASGQEISYSVRFPLGRIMAGGEWMGIPGANNIGWYDINGSVYIKEQV